MPAKRLFIGIPLPQEIARSLAENRNAANYPELAWVQTENLHITLLFIGNTNIEEIDKIKEKLASLVTFPTFCLHFREVQVVARRGKASMIWGAFENNEDFIDFATQIAQILNIHPDHPPLPHVTLARVKRNRSVKVDKNIFLRIGHMVLPVKKFRLYESNLTPQGAEYSVLEEWCLKDSGHDC